MPEINNLTPQDTGSEPGPAPGLVEQAGLREHAVRAVENYQQWAEKYPFAATTVETLAVCASRIAMRQIGKRFTDKNLGNAFMADPKKKQAIVDHPAFFGVMTIGVMPIIEELGSRALPIALANKQRNRDSNLKARTIEHLTQVGFAAWHAGFIHPEANFDPFSVSVRLKKREETASLPLSQFMSGEHLLRIYKKRGFWNAVGSHAVNNTLAAAIGTANYIKKNRA